MSAAVADSPGPGWLGAFGDATPAQVRSALTPESTGEFDRQWRAAMARATESWDLMEVADLLAGWRQVAAMTARLGHQGYRDFVARARNRASGVAPTAGSVGVAEVNALIEARLAQAR